MNTATHPPAASGPRPAPGPSASAPASAAAGRRRRVIDAPTRLFHWLFAACFAVAYLTGDSEHWRALHVTLGYTMAGLLVFRVLYGVFGPRQARLAMLWRKLSGAADWLRGARTAAAERGWASVNWRQGQNLLMALGMVALLAIVLPLAVSGYGTYDEWGDFLGGDWLEEVHEFFGNAMLAVVLLHIALIAGLSLLRRRNQALPMLTGQVEGPGPDLAKRNHGWLAALMLAAVVGFMAWQWQQYPNGLLPASGGGAQQQGEGHGDGDDD